MLREGSAKLKKKMLFEVRAGYMAEMWKMRTTCSCFSGENLLKSGHMEHW
jgi:hypothetical protein